MNKLYVIRWEEEYSDGSKSNGIYDGTAFISKEAATSELEVIKQDEMSYYEDNGLEMDYIKENTHNLLYEDGFIIELGDDYVKYVIEEVEVK